MKILKIQFQNCEKNEIHKSIFIIKKIMICLSITFQNYENHEIHRIPCQNNENHEKLNYSTPESRKS